MAGFVPGLLPTNHSQEKEYAQAYEDVLERYKGKLNTPLNILPLQLDFIQVKEQESTHGQVQAKNNK